MFGSMAPVSAGIVQVYTTHKRGFTVEEIAKMALDKMIFVADNAPEPIRDQANAFKLQLGDIMVHYLKMAVHQDRATICAKIREAGHVDLANHIRSI